MPLRRALALALGLLLAACGSAPVDPPVDPIDVARPTDLELAEAADRAAPEVPKAASNSTSRVLATVNGEVVNYRDVLLRIGPQLAVVEGDDVKREMERRELVNIVRERVLHQAAVEAGIEVTRDELDKERARRVRDLEKSGATLDAFLAERGMTRRELDDTLARDLRGQRFLRAAVGMGGEAAVMVRARCDIWVTPGEVRRFYDRNLDLYRRRASARVRMLKVKTDLVADDREAAVADARKRAEAIVARLRTGEDFVPVYRELNPEEPDPTDGLLEIPAEGGKEADWIREFAFGHARGTVSDPILKLTTFHVLRAEGVTAERVVPFVEAQSEIESLLGASKRAVASYEVELSLVEESVIRPPDLARAIREDLSAARRREAARAGL